ncbi:MAG TPA: M56 family metallopeptidase [Humisphaera sp.]|jgi:beta-lactamase regulating signal transducer with metallopeptidase domain|nr:M56 family metallopeptidase [Humisphaera sp.]
MQSLLQIGLANAVIATPAALAAWLLGRLIRRPALAHALWVLVLIKLLTPPIIQIPFAILPSAGNEIKAIEHPAAVLPNNSYFDNAISSKLATETSTDVREGHLANPTQAKPIEKPSKWRRDFHHSNITSLLGILWLTGSVLCGAIILARMFRFERLLRFVTPAPSEINDRIGQLSRRIRLRQMPDAYLVPGAVCPMLWCGMGRPRLLLPASFWAGLNPQQRDTVLLHELAHLRRRDHWVRWLEAAATTAFWWFPICWWARYELREAEEQCCDAWVVRVLPRSFHEYAAALIEAAEFVHWQARMPLLASGTSQFTHLKRRLMLMKRGNVPQSLRLSGICAAIGFGMLVLPATPIAARATTANPPARPPQDHHDNAMAPRASSMPVPATARDDDSPQKRLDDIESRANQMLLELRELRKQWHEQSPQDGGVQQR